MHRFRMNDFKNKIFKLIVCTIGILMTLTVDQIFLNFVFDRALSN